jgi:dipeptidyl aminopeptidase/acylaminoacyl peptidase
VGAKSTGSGTSEPFTPPPRFRRARVIVPAAIVLVLGVALSVWWTMARQPQSAAPASRAPVQRNLAALTFGPGLQSDPTWSPDGQSVAYASDRAGNLDIWVQPVGGGEAIQLTKSPASDTQPA